MLEACHSSVEWLFPGQMISLILKNPIQFISLPCFLFSNAKSNTALSFVSFCIGLVPGTVE